MTKHPCAGMTKTQRKVFEQIATGDALPRSTQKTIDRLVMRGLITRLSDKVLGRDHFGEIAIPQYEVPLLVHMQWCQWCTEQFEQSAAPIAGQQGGQT